MNRKTAQPTEAQAAQQGRFSTALRALRVRQYRNYLIAETVSLIGTWLQFTGQIWLVVQVLAPNDGFMLGVTSAVQSAPILLTLWGGAIADSRDKRKVLLVTQTVSGMVALGLGLTTWAGAISLPVVWVAAFVLGMTNSVDSPARQALVAELVDDETRPSAVALSSAVFQGTRAVGVGLAPVLVAAWGLPAPFLINALSFGVVLFILVRMKVRPVVPQADSRRALVREGLSELRTRPTVMAPLVILAVMAVFALNFDVTLPLLATNTLHSGLGLTSTLLTVSSIGAVVSSFLIATTRQVTDRTQRTYVLVLALSMCALALTRVPWLAIVIMFPLGGAIAATTASTSTLLLQRSEPTMRGRIMSVYGLIMQGSSLIGGLILGALADPGVWGAPGSLYVGAAAIGFGVALSLLVLAGRLPLLVAAAVRKRGAGREAGREGDTPRGSAPPEGDTAET
ncbi:MFS transporter [Streptomyces sp. NPDC047002]|uniref:MFS transporter n=1 Tax=Streptomyces sp. NPDC047002 TaxID=3155475 RepID=UPI003453FC1E